MKKSVKDRIKAIVEGILIVVGLFIYISLLDTMSL